MKGIFLKVFFILLMLIPLPFSCSEDCVLMELDVLPYFQMQALAFKYVDKYTINSKTEKPMFERISQNFATTQYTCENMALYFQVPDDELHFHSHNNVKKGFSFMQEAFACNQKQPGYAGTRDLIDKIFISTVYDFDDLHQKGYNIEDIVDIFAYTANGEFEKAISLEDYNSMPPSEAPKRFYIMIRVPASLSPVQQFIVRYFLMPREGEQAAVYFEAKTPVFNVVAY